MEFKEIIMKEEVKKIQILPTMREKDEEDDS